jgi:hypothetical protein
MEYGGRGGGIRGDEILIPRAEPAPALAWSQAAIVFFWNNYRLCVLSRSSCAADTNQHGKFLPLARWA